jgi:hypothetical protein
MAREELDSKASVIYEPRDKAMTAWSNPTDKQVKVDIYVGPGRFERYRIDPGQTVRIPSEYDRGVRTENDGQVVGGLAPQLIRIDGENPPVNAALDPDKAAMETNLQVAKDQMLELQAREKAILIAQARAEAAKAAMDKSAKDRSSAVDKK